MLDVSEKYREMAESNTREVSVKIEIGNYAVLTNEDIIELDIYRSMGESGFSIGGVVTTQMRLLALMKLPYTGGVTIDIFVGFGFDEKNASEYIQLGRFYGYATNPSFDTAQVEIIGYDRLGGSFLNRRFHGDYAPEFPCTVQDILDYICQRSNLECDFTCNNYSVSELPLKDRTRDDADYEKYYTYKEMLGFVAAAHGSVTAMDNNNRLVFFSVGEETETVDSADCIDFAFKSAEEFTVKGILLHAQDMLSTGSTNIFINDNSKIAYDGETADGVVEASCPFGSIEIAEELWRQLGGFSYYSCEFTRRGMGWTELGDVIYAVDSLSGRTLLKHSGKMIAQTVEWKFSVSEGFMEHIISKAESPEESTERLGNVNSINNGSGGVGEFTNDAKNSERFNDYEKNYINPKTPYAHVSGTGNSIDKDETLTSFSKGASILGGEGNVIQGATLSVIAGGDRNKILPGAVVSGILAGSLNSISGMLSGILAGNSNTITSYHSAIGAGSKNTVNGSNSAILTGQDNKVSATNSAILAGSHNNVKVGENITACGYGNYVERGNNGDFVSGCSNRVEPSSIVGRFICGTGGILRKNIMFAVGYCNCSSDTSGSEVDESLRNIFYIDTGGNVYAHSFNVIGAVPTASEASAASAISEAAPELSALTEQINQMKTEIEALKAEIEELKAR